MSIRRLFIKLFLISTILNFVTIFALVFIVVRMDGRASRLIDATESVRAIEEIQSSLFRFSRDSLIFGVKDGPRTASERERSRRRLFEGLEHSRKFVDSEEGRDILNRLEESVHEYAGATSPGAVRAKQVGPNSAASLALMRAYELAERLTENKIEKAHILKARLEADRRNAYRISVAIGILCLLGVVTAWFVVRNFYYLPITKLSKNITSVSGWDWKVRFPEEGPVEVKAIASAFNSLCEKLYHQRESRLRFLASVAHDLRNPMSAIQMSLRLLGDGGDAAENKKIVDLIGRQVRQMDRMVGDLLDSSRIESGHLELRIGSENIVNLVQQSVELYRPVSSKHEIFFRAPERAVHCGCDPLRISQVLNNLLSNAIKYSPGGGVIDVALEVGDSSVCIKVSDRGLGIEESEQDHIFEPFRRTGVDKATIPGVGLGLSVSKRIVEAHKGSISLESRPGRGSTFSVKLPLSHQAKSRPRDLEL